jgi:predicted dienelactone hydrolase
MLPSRKPAYSLWLAFWLPLFALLASGGTNQGRARQSSAPGYRLAGGPYSITGVDDVVLHDGQRNKDLHLRIYYPDSAGAFPVIVFSHGYSGSKDGYTGLTRFWAEHGYVTIQPTHDDSFALRRQQGGLRTLREAIGNMEEKIDDPNAWANRVRDITFVMDSFGDLERRVPGLKGKMDPRQIGVGGHSFGAYTTMLIGGATVDIPDGPQGKSYADSRPKALLVISGQGISRMGLTEHSWTRITRPMMVMTGSRDRGFKGQDPDWRKQPYDLSPAGDKFFVYIDGASHMTFTGRPAEMGREPTAPFEDAEISSLAFWDAYLKQAAAAKAYLASGALEADTRGTVALSRK